jgi:acetyltransferase-like isoleucine patch superfamily enzyme
MAFLPLRLVHLPEDTDSLYREWLDAVDRALDDPAVDRNALCVEILADLYGFGDEDADAGAVAGTEAHSYGGGSVPGGITPSLAAGDDDPAEPPPSLRSLTRRVGRAQLDPRNVALEPEFYRETDEARYAEVKPLLWLWEMFDRSPVGENTQLGIPFRRLLAKRIFKRCGRNFKAFPYVRLTWGYNLEVGDDVVVHRHVLLDDRGGIEIGDGASISDFANIYSHTHDITDGREVYTPRTVIGTGVRITYHATVLAGATVERDAMVGAGAILTRDAESRGVYVGVPARKVKEKDQAALDARPRATPDPLADDRVTTGDEAGEG